MSIGGGGLPGLFKEVAREQAEVVSFNSTQLVKLLKEEGKLKSSVKDIVTWLENKTGRELKMPTSPIKLKDFDGYLTKQSFDYAKLTSSDGATLVRPDPSRVWELIIGAENSCSSLGFSYLFRCVPHAPEVILLQAYRDLVTAFLSGRLGEHLSYFSSFMNFWVTNFPEKHQDQHNIPSQYHGCGM